MPDPTRQTGGKAGRPETLAQAVHWDSAKRRYLDAGFCDRCAAQAAWGHQIGFGKLDNEPCDRCAGLPIPEEAGERARRWVGEPGDATTPTTHPARITENTRTVSCNGCDTTWTAAGAAHCAAPGCHLLFATSRLFDQHRSASGEHGRCIPPERVVNRAGEHQMFLRDDGMWHGPTMTEAAKLARFGAAR